MRNEPPFTINISSWMDDFHKAFTEEQERIDLKLAKDHHPAGKARRAQLPDGLSISADGDLLNWEGVNYIRATNVTPVPEWADDNVIICCSRGKGHPIVMRRMNDGMFMGATLLRSWEQIDSDCVVIRIPEDAQDAVMKSCGWLKC